MIDGGKGASAVAGVRVRWELFGGRGIDGRPGLVDRSVSGNRLGR